MAGTIFLLDDRGWSNRSSVFYWVMDTMADHTENSDLSSRLQEISEFNLGSLDLASLSEAELEDFVSLAREMPRFARDELPDTPYRDAFVEHIVDFAQTIASDSGRPATAQE